MHDGFSITRRRFLGSGVAALSLGTLPKIAKGAGPAVERLVAGDASAPLGAGPTGHTEVWCYNGTVPGPALRVRQGDTLRVVAENRLAQDTTIHWHGVRVPNAMDGVPDLTQPPIVPGQAFAYEYELLDAGTYWYHSHVNSSEQIERGLAGALIVEEFEPPPVDRDEIWLLDDWRLYPDGSIAGGFDNMMDTGMAGRFGNVVTLNGTAPGPFYLRAGERIRLRLINVANARIFGLEFHGHRPWVVALDGQPVEPHEPEQGRVIVAPAQRTDIVLDAVGEAGARFPVRDTFYAESPYLLTSLAYTDEPSLRRSFPPPPELPANPQPEPDLDSAAHHEVRLGGGMMGGGMMGMMSGSMWAINGVTAKRHAMDPMLRLKQGTSSILAIVNDTAWFHPIHLHGHSFRVIGRNGGPAPRRAWRDTVLVPPRQSAEVAFVAHNPGDWLIHCHIPEHMAGGMMAVVRVG